MSGIVMKFGGTSVGDPEKIRTVANYINSQAVGKKVVVVISAMGKVTDEIENLFHQISSNPPRRELDAGLATGEKLAAALLATALSEFEGREAKSYTAEQMGLRAEGTFGSGRIVAVEGLGEMKKDLESGTVLVCAGFQGVKEKDLITLGRGGSDTSAVALAYALGFRCEIYTDVDGVYTADPRIVPNARRFDFLPPHIMLSLSSAGSGVLMDRAVILARDRNVPLRVLLSPSIGPSKGGTLVAHEVEGRSGIESSDGVDYTGLAIRKRIAVVTIDVPNLPLGAATLFKLLSGVVIGDVAQPQMDENGGEAPISISIDEKDLPRVEDVLKDYSFKSFSSCCSLTLVSDEMKESRGFISRFTQAIGSAGGNIQMMTSAGSSLIAVIHESGLNATANAVAKEFGLCN